MRAKTYLPFFIVLVSIFGGLPAPLALVGDKIVPSPQEIPGEVWPELTTKVLIKATPLTSVAIFAAYDYQVNYIPNLLKSQVIAEKVSKHTNDTHVAYQHHMPWPLSDSSYVHGHELSMPKPESYKVRWYMINSDSTDKVRGYALFAPHPENKNFTLMTYVTLVSPKSFIAGIFKKIMIKDVVKSLSAIRKTIEKLAREQPEIVEKYQEKIHSVLAGKKAYLP